MEERQYMYSNAKTKLNDVVLNAVCIAFLWCCVDFIFW